jgi:DHA1 family multidrug resistance protein-like MFS transporter
MFLLMGFTTNLYVLLILRIFQGLVGGISTIGLIIVSSSSSKENISSHMGIFQFTITLGLLVGPPLGSFAAATLGFKGAFMSASAVLFALLIFCHLYVIDVPRLVREERSLGRTNINRPVIIGWMLCFTTQIQLMFLPSVLPNVLEGFSIKGTVALKMAGVIVMIYTGTAVIGTYVWSYLARRFGLYRILTFLLTLGILLQALLAFSVGIIDFTVIRMVQTGLVAAIVPLIISLFASEPKGSIIGFLNSARFAGNALGPIVATSVLAFFDLSSVYLFISGMAAIPFLCFKVFLKTPNENFATQTEKRL